MKKLIYVWMAVAILGGCRKDVSHDVNNQNYLGTVLHQLRDSISPEDFRHLDSSTAFLSKPGKDGSLKLRIGFAGKPISEDFVLVQTGTAGNIIRGTIVHLENANGENPYQFNGAVSLRALSGRLSFESVISNGHIMALHQSRSSVKLASGTKTILMLPAPDADWLPEVVVVGYGGGSTSTPYISMDALLGGVVGGGVTAGGGTSDDGTASGGGGGGGNSSGGASPVGNPAPAVQYSPVSPARLGRPGALGVLASDDIDLEPEYINSLEVVDIRKIFNCFDLVPSDGAAYTVKLCADLPINSVPDASMNFSGRVNAGHSFLVVTKTGSGMTVTQSFGFYPSTAPSVWSPLSPLPSAVKDNTGAEINGSLVMSLTQDQFATLRSTAISLSSRPYMLDSWNCTDYAVGVANSVRATPIQLAPYIIRQAGITVGNGASGTPTTVTINNSPQMLYAWLAKMKTSGSAEASNIELDLSHNTSAPLSHGQCN